MPKKMVSETLRFSDVSTNTSTCSQRQDAISTLVEGIDYVNSFRKTMSKQHFKKLEQALNSSPTRRISSVLIVLRFSDEVSSQNNPWEVLLTLRTTRMRSHKGLVCLPGGKLDDGEDPVAGALREANEEVGLNEDDVEVLGMYDTTVTTNDTSVYTVISILRNADINLCKNPSEVEDMFWMPLAEFMTAENHRSEVIPMLAFMPLHYFDYTPSGTSHIYTIWGLTARLLMITANIVFRSIPEYIKPEEEQGANDVMMTGYIPSKL